MKTFPIATLVLLFLLFGVNCKKSSSSDNSSTTTTAVPKPTAVGTPTGAVTSKLIPKTGGTISSADGQLEIDFPAGALSADQTITIQPITNNCPNGNGLAYRLGPNGSTFNQPVTLKFHYPDSVLKSTQAGLMGLAFQDSTGVWYMLDNAYNDTIQHIISGKTTHFTDFNYMEEVAIEPVSATVKVNLAVALTATSIALQDEQPNHPFGYAILDGTKIIWAVNGITNGNSTVGTIHSLANLSDLVNSAVYEAPSTVPQENPVPVSGEFHQKFIVYNNDGTVTAFNKMIVYSHIYIVDGGYHVALSFEVDSLNESFALWNWKDQGSFDVVLAGTKSSVVNINNSPAAIGFVSNNSTCNVTLTSSGLGPINIVDSSFVGVNPVARNITVVFNALDQKNYIQGPVWNYACPGGDNGQLGGGSGPPFPAYIQFNMTDSVQTMVYGQYTIVVNAIK